MKATKRATIKDLKPNPVNPRHLSDAQRESMVKSLNEFGDLGGIVLNRRTGLLVGGHQRVEAFKADPKASVVTTDVLVKPDECGTLAYGYVETAGTRYSYREVDWPKPRETAAMLAANEHGGEFDWQGVSELLKSLDGHIDLTLTGFPQHELDNLLKAEWQLPGIEPMPTHGHGGKIDPIHLNVETRTALDEAKSRLGEADDVAAILKLCEHYKTGIAP